MTSGRHTHCPVITSSIEKIGHQNKRLFVKMAVSDDEEMCWQHM
jgi:hypothetical protein